MNQPWKHRGEEVRGSHQDRFNGDREVRAKIFQGGNAQFQGGYGRNVAAEGRSGGGLRSQEGGGGQGHRPEGNKGFQEPHRQGGVWINTWWEGRISRKILNFSR
jgi:hypothetical protein